MSYGQVNANPNPNLNPNPNPNPDPNPDPNLDPYRNPHPAPNPNPNPSQVAEGDVELGAGRHEGCVMRGVVLVNRVPGNFHISAHSKSHSFQHGMLNMSNPVAPALALAPTLTPTPTLALTP